MSVTCPECEAPVTATPTIQGEVVDCDDCGAELEVISLQPLQVEVAPEIQEDWGE